MYAKYKIKVEIGNDDDDDDEKSPTGRSESQDESWEEGKGEWTICDALGKEQSSFRIKF